MAALGPPPVPELFDAMEEGPERGGGEAGEAWLQAQGRALGHFVAGTWLKPPGRERLQGREEATGRALCSVPGGDVGDLAAAVAAAMAAPWGGLEGAQRGESLERLAGALEAGAAALGAVAALGTGLPLAESIGADLGGALRALRAAAAGARAGPSGLQGWSPLGVVAVVVSGPCTLTALMGTLGPLLAMGNGALVLVLLPPGGAGAALGPLLVAELGGAGGGAPLPPGVLNVVTGTPPLHRALRDLPGVSAVALLGDTEDPPLGLWGIRYLRGAPRGGHVIVIILDSADLDSAAAAIGGGGGRAPLPLTLVVLEALVPPLVRRLQARQGALCSGDPANPHVWGEGTEPRLLPVRSVPEALSVLSGLPPPAAASLWTQDLPLALDTAQRLPMELVWINALEVPQPWGGRGAIEMLRLFGRPPWAPPAPPLDEPPSPGGPEVTLDPGDVTAAMGVARRAAVGWARLEASARARVLQGALKALRGGAPSGRPLADDGGDEESLQGALQRWAARALLAGGAVKEAPGGRFLVTRRPLGVVGVAWSGPRPLRRALELLPPALAFGNALVVVAPPSGVEAARRLQKALEAAGLPGGALSVLPGGAAGSGLPLARERPDGLWLCGGDPDLDWGSIGGDPQVWVPGGGILDAPPHDADVELELRSTRPHSLWLPLTPDL